MKFIIGIILFCIGGLSSFIMFAKIGIAYNTGVGLSLFSGLSSYFAHDYYYFKKKSKSIK
ncbi:MAG: hypothetical protein JXQ68_08035 [Campylobacterales bacterium]|nr:hypothetical protein [Campylobacterales bacterium]